MRLSDKICRYADVAQLVEHHLAKVRVAGSNPAIRSATKKRAVPVLVLLFRISVAVFFGDVAEWLGRGLQNLVQRFKSARRLRSESALTALQSLTYRALGSGGERFLDTEEVSGSNPLVPTEKRSNIDILSILDLCRR